MSWGRLGDYSFHVLCDLLYCKLGDEIRAESVPVLYAISLVEDLLIKGDLHDWKLLIAKLSNSSLTLLALCYVDDADFHAVLVECSLGTDALHTTRLGVEDWGQGFSCVGHV